MLEFIGDAAGDVRAVAAEALGYLGETEKATDVLVALIENGNEHESLAAITALEAFGRSGVLTINEVKSLLPENVRGDSTRVVEAIEKIR